jgi:hypothetical protein
VVSVVEPFVFVLIGDIKFTEEFGYLAFPCRPEHHSFLLREITKTFFVGFLLRGLARGLSIEVYLYEGHLLVNLLRLPLVGYLF